MASSKACLVRGSTKACWIDSILLSSVNEILHSLLYRNESKAMDIGKGKEGPSKEKIFKKRYDNCVICAEKRGNNHANTQIQVNPLTDKYYTVHATQIPSHALFVHARICASSVDSVPFIKPTIREPLTKTRRD